MSWRKSGCPHNPVPGELGWIDGWIEHFVTIVFGTCLVMMRYFWKSLGPSWSSRVRRVTLTSGYLDLTSSEQKRRRTPATPLPRSWGATRRPSTSMVSPLSITHTDSRAIWGDNAANYRMNIFAVHWCQHCIWPMASTATIKYVHHLQNIAYRVNKSYKTNHAPLSLVYGPVWRCGWPPSASCCILWAGSPDPRKYPGSWPWCHQNLPQTPRWTEDLSETGILEAGA